MFTLPADTKESIPVVVPDDFITLAYCAVKSIALSAYAVQKNISELSGKGYHLANYFFRPLHKDWPCLNFRIKEQMILIENE